MMNVLRMIFVKMEGILSYNNSDNNAQLEGHNHKFFLTKSKWFRSFVSNDD